MSLWAVLGCAVMSHPDGLDIRKQEVGGQLL